MAANEGILVGTAGRGASAAIRAREKRSYERRFFLSIGVLFAALVVIGFSKNYYLRFLFDLGPLYSNLVRFHAVVMTAWVGLFVTQTWLISAKKVRLHMKLGWVGVGLAVLVLLTGYYVSLGALEHQTAADRGGIPPIVFLVVPIADLVLFVVLFGMAIIRRRRPADHKRLMLLTAANFLPPAAARFPVPALLALGPIWIFGVPTIFTVGALVYDTWRNRKLNRMFLAGSIVLIASFPLRLVIGQTDAWIRFATWLSS